jgi:hypothetical protein
VTFPVCPNEQGADGDGRYVGTVTFESWLGRNAIASGAAAIDVGTVGP